MTLDIKLTIFKYVSVGTIFKYMVGGVQTFNFLIWRCSLKETGAEIVLFALIWVL